MRPSAFFATLLVLLWSVSLRASWQQYAQGRSIIAIDFYDQHHGLVVFGDGPTAPIQVFHDSTYTAVSTNYVQQIVIQDSDRAWAFDRESGILYRASNRWTKWDSTTLSLPLNTQLVAATAGRLFFQTDSGFYYTVNGDTAIRTSITGRVNALDYLNATTLVAVTDNFALTSNDGGNIWTTAFILFSNCKSLFIDRVRGDIYTGGDQLRRSTDSGKTWKVVLPPPEMTINIFSGQVFGVHDCTGAFYLGSANNIYRSRDAAQSFEEVGPSLFGALNQHAWVFDRGSTVFWWEGIFHSMTVSFDGIDGVMTDSVGRELTVACDTISDTACTTPTNLTVSVLSSTCVPIRIDSISTRATKGRITTSITPQILNGDSASFTLPYSARSAGLDSLVLRLWFHGIEGQVREYLDFSTLSYDYSLPAILAAPDSIQFGNVHVDSTKSVILTISNSGCAPLRVDSIRSSNPGIFRIAHAKYPMVIGSDSTISLLVTFAPTRAGVALESVELGTSVGHRFIELDGTGFITQNLVSKTPDIIFNIYPNPAAAELHITSTLLGNKYVIRDLLGRVITQGKIAENDQPVSLDGITSGIYFVEIAGTEERIVISRQ